MSRDARIVNVEPRDYSDDARQHLQRLGTLHECEPCDRAALLREVADAQVLITRLAHQIDADVFAAAPGLRAVVTATTGLTHIDLDAAERSHVAVLSLKGETAFLESITATAELTWGLLLSVCRRLPAAVRDVGDGRWQRDAFKGRELKGKTLGILGLGRLGCHVAAFGQAFQMRVIACDPNPQRVPDHVDCVTFETLLAESDLVSVHVDLNPTSRALLDASAFARMKRDAILVNSSRGEVIVEADLIDALEAEQLGGAGLDVLAGEPFADDAALAGNALWQWARAHDNVVISPHIGGATHESMAATERFMVDKLERWLNARSDEQEETA